MNRGKLTSRYIEIDLDIDTDTDVDRNMDGDRYRYSEIQVLPCLVVVLLGCGEKARKNCI